MNKTYKIVGFAKLTSYSVITHPYKNKRSLE